MYSRPNTVSGASSSLLGNCGLGSTPDIGRPDVKNDGDTVAFAGRASATDTWHIYTVSISDPTTCAEAADGHTYVGCDFWPTVLDNIVRPDFDYAVIAANAGTEEAEITVERGDSLWRISRKMLGAGPRYTQIYEANSKQIRNPNLIYPGQVFVVPHSQ